MNPQNLQANGHRWLLGQPSVALQLWADSAGVVLENLEGWVDPTASRDPLGAETRLGRLIPILVRQLCELGLASVEDGRARITYEDFTQLEGKGIDAFEGLWRWSPFSLELECTGWLQSDSFRYFVRFYLGSHAVHLERMGCFVRRGQELYRLDEQVYSLLDAIDCFNALPTDARAGTTSLIHFAQIKGMAQEVGAQLDQYLTRERVLVPPQLGLDVIVDDQQRVTFVPRVDGVADEAMRESFLELDDVDDCYNCRTPDGGRLRVILSHDQREVLRRMQRVRHVGGAEKAEIMRNPYAVFDGVADSVDIDLNQFGPRVNGVGDFPFVVRPYLQRSVTGIFEDCERLATPTPPKRLDAGVECRYPDGTVERVVFNSREELMRLLAEVQEARRSGTGQVPFRRKDIEVNDSFLRALEGLAARVSPKPTQTDSEPREGRKFVLIYTNEGELDYSEEYSVATSVLGPEIPECLAPGVKLKTHQLEGLAWLQLNHRIGRHGCLLADDMGLGKTLQALVFLAWLIENGALSTSGIDPERAPWNPILIVMPVILLENEVWINDMKRFFANDGAVFQPWLTLHGSALNNLRRAAAAGRETVVGESALELEALQNHRVIFTNYETITNYQHSFARMNDRWAVVVTDEAQEYKTPSTKVSHALKSLNPRFRIACTGTPVETRLLDVWNIFDFLQPGRLLGSSSEFAERFERNAEVDGTDTPSNSQVRELRRVLRYGKPDAFVLRRNKSEIPSLELPSKHEHKLRCPLGHIQRQWHLEVLGRAQTGGAENHPFALLQQLMKIYQHPALVPNFQPTEAEDAIEACPKLKCLIEQLEAIRREGEKALIFTRSLDMQQLLASVIESRLSVAAEIVNGATSRRGGTRNGRTTRQSILGRFREAIGFDVLILSPDVAGMGLTIVEANHVFHYGRWWNPAKEAQATDRVYRIGQTKTVNVYQLIAVDPLKEFVTFDEKLDALIERRRNLAADFLAPMPSEDELQSEMLNDMLGEAPVSRSALPFLGMEEVRRLSWDRFEALAGALWERQGAKVMLTPRSCDEGVDAIAIRESVIELIQCKHTSSDGAVDADVVAEVIQSFDGYRAKRFRGLHGRLTLRNVLVTNGKPTAQARRVASERDVQIYGGTELRQLLSAYPCSAADIETANSSRLATMRDVQARIAVSLR